MNDQLLRIDHYGSRRPQPPGDHRHHRGSGAHTHGAPDPGRVPGAPLGSGARAASTAVDVHMHLLAANDRHAQAIRALLAEHGVFAANLMSSPGAGKTALLEATLARLGGDLRLAVIEGDIETTADADRLAPYGIPVVQINTGPFGGDCHLAAPLVAGALEKMELPGLDALIVENVGNLVCPAEFDIGEDRKVVLLSVTEGEDKPLKYPLMFHEAHVVLVTKIDLLPHLDADLDLIRTNVRKVNPRIPLLPLSARTGEGMEAWLAWLREGVAAKRARR
ncbi:MAG: hydrogenase nickel incorporation protein HypB [Thermoleophilia bacterium]